MNKFLREEIKIILWLTIILFVMLSGIFYFDYLQNVTYSSSNEKILSLSYKEINERYNEFNIIKRSFSEVNYIYPDKLRIENFGEINTIEINNNSRFYMIDKKSRKVVSGFIKTRKLPKALEKSKYLCKIIETGKYESYGFEEKDNRKLKVLAVIKDGDNNNYTKYWIVEYNGTLLPYIEEYFLNNKVISKTSYQYQKINVKIENEMFHINW